MTWTPIEDLPENWPGLGSSELASLAPIWVDQAKRLDKTDALRDFNARLAREWAIETGIIENLYSIDRGTTQLLIEKGIDASLIAHGSTDKPTDEVVSLLRDQHETLDGLFEFVASRRALTTSYIRELHSILTRHQDTTEAVDKFGTRLTVELLKGEWKNHPNNPTRPDGSTHEYCPPVQVASEMDRLVHMNAEHDTGNVPAEVSAAWLHHRFTQIHPFQDGNGRVARALATLVFLRQRWFPLVISRDDRDPYIRALEKSDGGEIKPLVDLFARIQKKAFLRALSISEEVLRADRHVDRHVRIVIDAATRRLRRRLEEELEKRARVFEKCGALEQLAYGRFAEVANDLGNQLRDIAPKYRASAEKNNEDTDFWFRRQIIYCAKKLDYFADPRTYRSWVRLKIREDRHADIVVSFHSLGRDFVGVLAASAFIQFRDVDEGEEASVEEPHILSGDVFQFSYDEDRATIRERFAEWLEAVLVAGLEEWRKQL